MAQREHPAQQQRNGYDDEQRFDDLGDRRRGQVQRQERADRNERGSEQAPLRSGGSVDQRLPSSRAAQDRVLRVVGYDDRVIDQHSHRDDESGQRSTVQADAEKLHDQQRAADGEDQRTADQYAGAQTHDQHD